MTQGRVVGALLVFMLLWNGLVLYTRFQEQPAASGAEGGAATKGAGAATTRRRSAQGIGAAAERQLARARAAVADARESVEILKDIVFPDGVPTTTGTNEPGETGKGTQEKQQQKEERREEVLVVEKQTIVLPIGPKDLERFENLYKTLDKFFDFSEVHEWIIVLPSRDSELAARILELTAAHGSLIRMLEDTEVVPALAGQDTFYWMTQQILKLGIAQFVKTDFFLVLDADLVCFKPTGFSDLIVNGRALTNMYDSPHVVHHEAWWKSSETVLDMKMDAPMYFGVTPCLLATSIVQGVYRRLEEVHGQKWDEFLVKNVQRFSFTEYCIYAVYAVATGMFQRFHVPAINAVYDSERSMWWENEFDSVNFEELVTSSDVIPGHFVVMQSNTKIPAERVKEKMGSWFD